MAVGEAGMTLPLHTYVAAVEAITHVPLPADDILEAMMMRDRGITPEEFAYWISLTASPSISPALPLAPPRDGASDPREVHESLAGEDLAKEIA
jgi:hypothetical protein